MNDQRCAVYRCFDEEGALLYVGSSIRPNVRWSQHKQRSPWAHLCTKRTVEWFDTIYDAQVEEGRAIREEEPIHNKNRVMAGTGGEHVPWWMFQSYYGIA